jgi:hypothetical protein
MLMALPEETREGQELGFGLRMAKGKKWEK